MPASKDSTYSWPVRSPSAGNHPTHTISPSQNRTASTARRQRSTPPLVLNLEMESAPCLWHDRATYSTPYDHPKRSGLSQAVAVEQSPFRLMILYRDHVLIGCLFDLPLVSKLQTASRKITAWLWQPPRCPTSNHPVQACNLPRGRLASKCLTSSPSVKIETRFYPFLLISGRIEWPHTKSDTLTSESLSVKHVYIMTKAAFGVQKLHLCIFKCFP